MFFFLFFLFFLQLIFLKCSIFELIIIHIPLHSYFLGARFIAFFWLIFGTILPDITTSINILQVALGKVLPFRLQLLPHFNIISSPTFDTQRYITDNFFLLFGFAVLIRSSLLLSVAHHAFYIQFLQTCILFTTFSPSPLYYTTHTPYIHT